MATLPTNFQDAEYSGLRKYIMLDNGDGTVSLQDVTTYKKMGSIFGAEQINAANQQINDLKNSVGGCTLQQSGSDFYIVGADAVRKKLGSGKIKRTQIYSGNSLNAHTVNLTGYTGWQNFTMDNFCIGQASEAYTSTTSQTLGNILLSYNNSTGVLSLGRSASYEGSYGFYINYTVDLIQVE